MGLAAWLLGICTAETRLWYAFDNGDEIKRDQVDWKSANHCVAEFEARLEVTSQEWKKRWQVGEQAQQVQDEPGESPKLCGKEEATPKLRLEDFKKRIFH